MHEIERKSVTILDILSKEKEPLGAGIISKRLKSFGIDLSERAVRYHLQLMDERGLTEVRGKEGRLLTVRGKEELSNALVADKLGLVITKIDTLSFMADLNLAEKTGRVILNVTLMPREVLDEALGIMKDAFAAKLGISDLVAIATEGEFIGSIEVPPGSVAFGTICSITLNSIFLQAGIPVDSKFGGILQFDKGEPLRFTELITYAGTTIDPLEIFIASKMTSVQEVALTGSGKILAGFREIPAVAADKSRALLAMLEESGFYGVLRFGRPGQAILETEVSPGRMGLVVMGGLNPLAALEESGIKTDSKAMSTLIDFDRLVSFWNL
ncbi:MAG: NrpR regulatory domain-containing protein [Candidatus Aquicultor sp.]|nr:NrpR regulatory domain-containing protein [Candidatus Aquicultor sp.]